MIKTSPINIQTHAAGQSPPLISSESDDGNDQKARNDGVKCRGEEKVCVINVRNVGEKDDVNKDEKVCRICQLSSDQLPASAENVNLVLLGCNCKGDLGVSHYHCAFVWFKQKGNRTCEICGKPAKNIQGIEDTGFGASGQDISIISATEFAMRTSASDGRHRCTKSSLCNFMLAALVMAFLLSWAIHPSSYHHDRI